MISTEQLIAYSGEIYCHLFENQSQGIGRNLFWSVTVDFMPIPIGDEECECSAICDWIKWPIKRWLDLDGCNADFENGDRGYESSFYLFEHHSAQKTTFSLSHSTKNFFEVSLIMQVHIPKHVEIEVNEPLVIQSKAIIPFTGLIIIPQNLILDSRSKASIMNIASEFIDLKSFSSPQPYMNGFRFSPIW